MGYFGLLGYPLSHSFSAGWFSARAHRYDNFEYATVEEFLRVKPAELEGFNVTIPHKQSIIAHLDSLDATADKIGAVNCVKILADGSLRGYNTDAEGFRVSLLPVLGDGVTYRAAVLGSGGASLAVRYVLGELGIDYRVVSRQDGGYSRLDIGQFNLIVNTTPLGMFPNVGGAPSIDYERVGADSVCYDLVYNPSQTLFVERCRRRGATVVNGLAMLNAQAEAALLLFAAK